MNLNVKFYAWVVSRNMNTISILHIKFYCVFEFGKFVRETRNDITFFLGRFVVFRYNILAAAAVANAKNDKAAAKSLFEIVGLEAEKYRLGHTKASNETSFVCR